MRSRNIKPGVFKNEVLAECDPLARVLFMGLWCMADREGYLQYRPKKIGIEILPYDSRNIEKLLEQLSQHGFIIIWCSKDDNGGKHRCIVEVVNFRKHQNPHKNEKPSEIKPLFDDPEITRKIVKLHELNSTNPADSLFLIPDVLIPEGGKPPQKKPPKKQKSKTTQIPSDFKITDAMETWFTKQDFRKIKIQKETEKFIDHWKAKGETKKDWVAAWRNWMRKAEEWSRETPRGECPTPTTYAQHQDAERRDMADASLKYIRRKYGTTNGTDSAGRTGSDQQLLPAPQDSRGD